MTSPFSSIEPPVVVGSYYCIPFYHPPGKLDVDIREKNGCCVVIAKRTPTCLFQIGDIIDGMDGEPFYNLGIERWIEMTKLSVNNPWRLFNVRRLLPGAANATLTNSPSTANNSAITTKMIESKHALQNDTNIVTPLSTTKPSAASKMLTCSVKKTSQKDIGRASSKKKIKEKFCAKASTEKSSLKPSALKWHDTLQRRSRKLSSSSKKKKKKKAKPELSFLPRAGRICSDQNYYSTLNNENLLQVSEKLGLAKWRDLANIDENIKRYGMISANALFKPQTLLRIPTNLCSKWKLENLLDKELEEVLEMSVCMKCNILETPEDTDPMLLCDGCNSACHLSCTDMTTVPDGDWLCGGCSEILQARRDFYYKPRANGSMLKDATLIAELPTLPALPRSTRELACKANEFFTVYITDRKQRMLRELGKSHKKIGDSLEQYISTLSADDPTLHIRLRKEKALYEIIEKKTMRRHGIAGYGGEATRQWVTLYVSESSTETIRHIIPLCPHLNSDWRSIALLRDDCKQELRTQRQPLTQVETEIETRQEELEKAQYEESVRKKTDRREKEALLLEFAALLNEPQNTSFETTKAFLNREPKPSFLGIYRSENALDTQVLNILQEPTKLIVSIPTDYQKGGDTEERITTDREYAIFARSALLCPTRDDSLPMDFRNTSVRSAQKHLFATLMRDPRNLAGVVKMSAVPSSIKNRGVDEENTAFSTTSTSSSSCFYLSELVRDCNCPLDMPKAPTPKRLAENGLVLRGYQQASLQWMLDKEHHPSGLGIAGELWHRLQFLDGSGDYFFCELTGTFLKDIYNFQSDVAQNVPIGGILGEEMGLGKTVICISLVIANPPPKHNQVLPREHLLSINHDSYVIPPVVGCMNSAKKKKLSNGNLVVAPMALCSQWQSEIQKFAPWMSVLTLHCGEQADTEEIASKDFIIVSTFLLQSDKSKELLRAIKKIHFHRFFLDESHDETGVKIKQTLTTLSSTYRYCVTGTPIGNSLDDLYEQICFLRVPQFCRTEFWEHNVATPYYERNYDALQVLRSLLSHVVIRHSKEQTLENGNAMLALPPRSVETILLNFGSDGEKKVYEVLEARNTKRFMELTNKSPQAVLGKYMELIGIVYAARQACAHTSLVNLDKIHNCNVRWGLEMSQKYNCDDNVGHIKPKNGSEKTREGILTQAVDKARPSAQIRMRDTVLQFHNGDIDVFECCICLEPTSEADVALTPCAHKFCAECIVNILDGASSTRKANGRCPECREIVTRSELTFLGDAKEANKKISMIVAKKEDMSGTTTVDTEINGFHFMAKDVHSFATESNLRRASYQMLSPLEKRQQRACSHTISGDFFDSHTLASSCIGTKISRLLEEVRAMMNADSKSKCVVFSQFLSTLCIASEEMLARGIRFVRVDGTMKQHQHADALLDFSSDPNIRVFLLSMRAGAANPNMVAADHCFILDTPMNSAIEEQAIDRIHRIGQTRPVHVKRFIIKNTVEERILASRRKLGSDIPQVSTPIDGAGIMDNKRSYLKRPSKRARYADENALENRNSQRLKLLEALFDCSAI